MSPPGRMPSLAQFDEVLCIPIYAWAWVGWRLQRYLIGYSYGVLA